MANRIAASATRSPGRLSRARRTLSFPREVTPTNAVRAPTFLPQFGPLGVSHVLTRLGRALPRRVHGGELLVPQGVDDPRCWLVVTGAVACSVVAATGKRALLEILGPGDLATGSSMDWLLDASVGPAADPDPVRPELRALTPGRLMVIPGADLARAVEIDPGLRAWVHERVVARLHRTQTALAEALTLSVPERLHRFLLGLTRAHGQQVPGGVQIGLPLTQDTLAAAVGASRETANRAVRAMQSRGLVVREGRTYTVLRARPGRESGRTASPPPGRAEPGLRSPA